MISGSTWSFPRHSLHRQIQSNSQIPKMYSIKSVPGKDLGMIANIDIIASTRIMVDNLLFSIEDYTEDRDITEKPKPTLERLDLEQQQQYEALHSPKFTPWSPPVRRYIANAFGISKNVSGIFLKAARINHSCRPNAHYTWNDNLGKLTIYAMVHVLAGAEISIRYLEMFPPRLKRNHQLHRIYGLERQCQVCCPGTQREHCTRQCSASSNARRPLCGR